MNSDVTQTAPAISFDELMARLNDIETPDEKLDPYLIAVPSSTGRIDPSFEPNPALVTGLETGLEGALIVNGLNNRYRRQRNRAYKEKIAAGWTGPRIVDEGDSWFQYPLRLRDIIDFLAEDHAVYSLSGAGHTLAQMIEQDEIITTVARENADVLLLSAGGNDLFQGGNIANLIETVVPGMPAKDLVGPKFDRFLAEVIGSYRDVLLRLHRAFPDLLMLIHGYAAAYSQMNRWIGRPLHQGGVGNTEAHNRIVEVMLERFNSAQIALSREHAFGGKLVHVDLRRFRGERDNWFDEIHMGPAQNKAAAGWFAEVIKEELSKGGLESGVAPEAMADATTAVAAHARELMGLDEATLLAELDQRLDLVARDPAASDLPSSSLLVLAGGLESGAMKRAPSGLALRLLNRWERELYALICGDGDEDAELRNELREALGVSTDSLIMLVTGWLVSGPLGVSALLAGVLAAILVKRFGGATYDVVCEAWKERFDGEQA